MHSGAPTLHTPACGRACAASALCVPHCGRAAREVEGQKVDKLHAHAYHIFRCTHKTKSQYISILHLLAMYATHPELRPWLWASQSAILINFAQ